MNKIFCQKCGKANEYANHPPKFCGGCGNNMTILLSDSDNDGGEEESSAPVRARKRGGVRKSRMREKKEESQGFIDIDLDPDEIEDIDLGGVSVTNLKSSNSESFSLKIGVPEKGETE